MTKIELLDAYRSEDLMRISNALCEIQKDSYKIIFTGMSGPNDNQGIITDITGICGMMYLNNILDDHGVVELIEGDDVIYRRTAFRHIKQYLPNASEIFGDDEYMYFKISRRINNNQHNEVEFLDHRASRVARALFSTYSEEITKMEEA